MTQISLTVDGDQVTDDVEPRMLLVQYLREKLGKTGTVIGCDTSNCGACTVHLNGTSVKSCNVLAVQADGAEVTTIEGLAAADGELHPVQEAFRPERFTAERRAALPKGAYVPFGGGSRQCIGMRFGQLEIKAIAARILREHRLELEPGYRLEVRQTPTLGPRRGMPMRVRRG